MVWSWDWQLLCCGSHGLDPFNHLVLFCMLSSQCTEGSTSWKSPTSGAFPMYSWNGRPGYPNQHSQYCASSPALFSLSPPWLPSYLNQLIRCSSLVSVVSVWHSSCSPTMSMRNLSSCHSALYRSSHSTWAGLWWWIWWWEGAWACTTCCERMDKNCSILCWWWCT